MDLIRSSSLSLGFPVSVRLHRSRSIGLSLSVANVKPSLSFVCKAGPDKEPKANQLDAGQVLAEILKAENKYKRADELVDNMSQEFFHIVSTYLSKARKENNVETVERIELALKAAMKAKDKTLSPEVQLFNKLLRNNSSAERQQTIQDNYKYLHEGSYFFEILSNTRREVEALTEKNPEKGKLLIQLRIIEQQTKKVASLLKEAPSR